MAEIEVQKRALVPALKGEAGEAGAKLAHANDQALDHVIRFFEHATSYDLDDRHLARLANDMALGIITRQIRVDDGRWKQGSLDVIGELLREIAAAREAKPPVVDG